MVLHLKRVPIAPGMPARDQFRAGREDLQSTPFEVFERHIRDDLGRALADPTGAPLNIAGHLQIDRWQGAENAQLIIEDAAIAE